MSTKPCRDSAHPKSRADLLAEIVNLPKTAFVSTASAAAYIGSAPGVMLNWRSQRRGPRYHGKDDFVRYRISDLDLWMSSRADEVRPDERSTGVSSAANGCKHNCAAALHETSDTEKRERRS